MRHRNYPISLWVNRITSPQYEDLVWCLNCIQLGEINGDTKVSKNLRDKILDDTKNSGKINPFLLKTTQDFLKRTKDEIISL